MVFDPKSLISNYFKRKKPLSIISDVVFVLLVILLLIPSTRREIAGVVIGVFAFPPSSLDNDEQYYLSEQSLSWTFYDLDGKKVNYQSFDDKPVFVNIWATWCPPCVGELPSIKSLYAAYGDRVHFLLLSDENPEKVRNFADKHQYSGLPFYYYRNLPTDFSTTSIPTTFVINGDHKVVIKKKGAADWDSDKVTKLLDELLLK